MRRDGITQQALAHRCDVGARLVWAWQSDGDTDPSWPNLLRLAELFDVKPEWFYADNPETREEARAA